jgi:8-oxo-dGTP pyrophosphatase MutT (NUDIX family)
MSEYVPKPPIQIAGVVLRNADNEIYMLHRRDNNWWEIPGGKVRNRKLLNQETPENAAIREALEEMGVEVVLTGEKYSTEYRSGRKKLLFTAYEAQLVSGVPYPQEDDVHDDGAFKAEYHVRRIREHLAPAAEKLLHQIFDSNVVH